MSLSEINQTLTLACVGFGLIAFLSPALRFSAALPAVMLALDFWTAAGLMRLAGNPTWSSIATAAAIIAIRKLTNFGLVRPNTEGFRNRID